jgi:hypothetical protein
VPVVTSKLAFGGYTFPAGFMLLSRDQPSVIDEQKIPYSDGANIPQGSRGAKVIVIKGTIGGSGAVDSGGSYIQNRDQAEAELNLMSSYLESGYQQLSVGAGTFAGAARYIVAQKRKFTVTYAESAFQAVIDVQIELVAQDPRWLASAAATIGPSTSILNLAQTIGGSTITYPVATFVGAYQRPYLNVNFFGGRNIQIGTIAALGAGDTFVIDTDPRNRANGMLLNGVPRLDLIDMGSSVNTAGDAAFFPYLLPQALLISADSLTAVRGTSVTVTWREAYSF